MIFTPLLGQAADSEKWSCRYCQKDTREPAYSMHRENGSLDFYIVCERCFTDSAHADELQRLSRYKPRCGVCGGKISKRIGSYAAAKTPNGTYIDVCWNCLVKFKIAEIARKFDCQDTIGKYWFWRWAFRRNWNHLIPKLLRIHDQMQKRHVGLSIKLHFTPWKIEHEFSDALDEDLEDEDFLHYEFMSMLGDGMYIDETGLVSADDE